MDGFDTYASRVFLDNSVRHGQPEPGSLAHAFGGVKRIVNLGDVLGSDTNPRVRDLGDE